VHIVSLTLHDPGISPGSADQCTFGHIFGCSNPTQLHVVWRYVQRKTSWCVVPVQQHHDDVAQLTEGLDISQQSLVGPGNKYMCTIQDTLYCRYVLAKLNQHALHFPACQFKMYEACRKLSGHIRHLTRGRCGLSKMGQEASL